MSKKGLLFGHLIGLLAGMITIFTIAMLIVVFQ